MKELIGHILRHEVKPRIEKLTAKAGELTREAIKAERKLRMDRLAGKILANTKDHMGEQILLGESTLKVEKYPDGFMFTLTEPRPVKKTTFKKQINIEGLADQYTFGIAGYHVTVEGEGLLTTEYSSFVTDPINNTLTPADALRYFIDANTIAKSLQKPLNNA